MLSSRSANSLRNDPAIAAVIDIQQQLELLNQQIAPLQKTAKKLVKLEDELAQTNLLIDSGIGPKQDLAALRKTKKDLRQQRVVFWGKLEALPALKKKRAELTHELECLERRHGLLL